EALGSNRSLAIVFQTELRHSAKFLGQFSHNLLVEYFDVIKSVLREGQEAGVFRADISITIAAHCFFGAVDEIVTTWILSERDRVAILSENRPEWMIADFACVSSGIIDVPIYATLTAEQTLYLLQNSRARIVFVSTLEQLRKVQSIQTKTSVEKIVVMDDVAEVNVIPM